MNTGMVSPPAATSRSTWRQAVASFQHADVRQSVWQLVNSLVPYVVLWGLMLLSLRVSYWLTLILAIPAAGFLVRAFIIFHDCCHGSFFKSKEANDIAGTILGVLTFTPYYSWRHSHALHHAGAGDLDRRGTGDVWTMTVAEYQAASPLKRFGYRFFRFPAVTFGLGPLFMFLILHRLPVATDDRRERISVWATTLALAGIIVLAGFTIGIKAYIMIQLPLLWISGVAGVWMFYVQHNFEGTYWEHHDRWDFVAAALDGSSFYKLPVVLQWFTGNIGFHHIHHLSPRIPNYFLQRCHEAHPIFKQVKPITLLTSLRSLRLRLWDEEQRKLVGFKYLRTRPANARG